MKTGLGVANGVNGLLDGKLPSLNGQQQNTGEEQEENMGGNMIKKGLNSAKQMFNKNGNENGKK